MFNHSRSRVGAVALGFGLIGALSGCGSSTSHTSAAITSNTSSAPTAARALAIETGGGGATSHDLALYGGPRFSSISHGSNSFTDLALTAAGKFWFKGTPGRVIVVDSQSGNSGPVVLPTSPDGQPDKVIQIVSLGSAVEVFATGGNADYLVYQIKTSDLSVKYMGSFDSSKLPADETGPQVEDYFYGSPSALVRVTYLNKTDNTIYKVREIDPVTLIPKVTVAQFASFNTDAAYLHNRTLWNGESPTITNSGASPGADQGSGEGLNLDTHQNITPPILDASLKAMLVVGDNFYVVSCALDCHDATDKVQSLKVTPMDGDDGSLGVPVTVDGLPPYGTEQGASAGTMVYTGAYAGSGSAGDYSTTIQGIDLKALKSNQSAPITDGIARFLGAS